MDDLGIRIALYAAAAAVVVLIVWAYRTLGARMMMAPEEYPRQIDPAWGPKSQWPEAFRRDFDAWLANGARGEFLPEPHPTHPADVRGRGFAANLEIMRREREKYGEHPYPRKLAAFMSRTAFTWVDPKHGPEKPVPKNPIPGSTVASQISFPDGLDWREMIDEALRQIEASEGSFTIV